MKREARQQHEEAGNGGAEARGNEQVARQNIARLRHWQRN
jgi:hypothetical protein